MFWLLFRSLTRGVYVCGEILLCNIVYTLWSILAKESCDTERSLQIYDMINCTELYERWSNSRMNPEAWK